ncbi:MAG: PAS domain S-box protein [Acidobacteriota bacterium]
MADTRQTKAQLLVRLREAEQELEKLRAELSARRDLENLLSLKEREPNPMRAVLTNELEKAHQVEDSLKACEEKYEAFIDQCAEGIWRVELAEPMPITLPEDQQIEHFYAHGYLAECNPAMATMHGFTDTKGRVGAKFGDLFARSDPQNLKILQAFIRSGYHLTNYQSHRYDKDNHLKYFSNDFLGIIQNGYLLRAWNLQRDVTPSKLLELELTEKNALLNQEVDERKQIAYELLKAQLNIQTLLNAIPDLLFRVRSDGTYLAFKLPPESQVFDNPPDLVGKTVYEVLPPEVARQAMHYITQALKTGAMQKFEYQLTAVGQAGWYEARVIASGKDEVIAIVRDITESKEAELGLRESEGRFQSLARSSPVGIYRLDKTGKCVYVNERWSEIVGISKTAALGYGWIKALHPDDREKMLQVARDTSRAGTDFHDEYRFQRPDGKTVWVYGQAVPERDAHGDLIGYVGTLTDITERVKSEQALRESEERFQALARSSPVGIYCYQTDGRFVYVNERWGEIVGLSREQAMGFGWVKTLHPDDREKVLKIGREATKTGSEISVEYRILRPDGRIVWIYGQAVPEYNNEGELIGFIGTLTDITERVKAEEALRESEARFRVIAEASVGVIMMYDTNSFLYVNPATEAITGYSREELLRMNPFDLMHPDYRGFAAKRFQSRLQGTTVEKSIEYKIVTKSGEERWVEFSVGDFINYQGKKVATATAFDITERKRAEELLAAEKERLSVTLRSIGDGVIATDTDERIVLINRVAEKLTGWKQEEAIGKPLNEIFHIINERTREIRESPVKKVLQTGKAVGMENRTLLIAKDGKEYPIADSGAPIHNRQSQIIGMVLVFRDTTEERKREEELLKASKLESIGILAGGIAHDFNNILAAVLGNISLAKRFIDADHKAYARLGESELATLRAKDLTQQLLTFAKGGAPVKKTISIAPLLRENISFALTGSNIQPTTNFQTGLWLTEIDEGQISQVIHNLVLNARQSMPLGGMIEISAINLDIHPNTLIQGIPIKPGHYLKIAIKDEGVGIAEEHLSKIFDPYFTTKQRGSGLGLATAYSIIKNHEGYIFVESQLGSGASFIIYLPALNKPAAETLASIESSASGKGKILVMDDEKIIRDMLNDMLVDLGYEFTGTASGEEAIAAYKDALQRHNPFNAVIMDLTVPGKMGGQEAVKKILEIDPRAKCIVSSGYSTAPVMADHKKFGFVEVIAKPFQISELSDVLHNVLSKPESLN